MKASGSHHCSSLVDVTQMPMAQLRMLDDAVFAKSLDSLLRTCDSDGDRRWDSGADGSRDQEDRCWIRDESILD